MSGFLTRLTQRTLGETPGLAARPRSRFEPAPSERDRVRGIASGETGWHTPALDGFTPGAALPETDGLAAPKPATPHPQGATGTRRDAAPASVAPVSGTSSALSASPRASAEVTRPAVAPSSHAESETDRRAALPRSSLPTRQASRMGTKGAPGDGLGIADADGAMGARFSESPPRVAARAIAGGRLTATSPAIPVAAMPAVAPVVTGTGRDAGAAGGGGDPVIGPASASATPDMVTTRPGLLHATTRAPAPPPAGPSPIEARPATVPSQTTERSGRSEKPDDRSLPAHAPERPARPVSAAPAFPPAFVPPAGTDRTSRAAAESSAPTVEVRIGRIEVRAEPPAAPAPRRGPAAALARLPSLADHLARPRGR